MIATGKVRMSFHLTSDGTSIVLGILLGHNLLDADAIFSVIASTCDTGSPSCDEYF